MIGEYTYSELTDMQSCYVLVPRKYTIGIAFVSGRFPDRRVTDIKAFSNTDQRIFHNCNTITKVGHNRTRRCTSLKHETAIKTITYEVK
jgi:hypothetical protein